MSPPENSGPYQRLDVLPKKPIGRGDCLPRNIVKKRLSILRTDPRSSHLLPNYLHENAFAPFSIELSIENLLPGSEIEFAACDCHDYLSAHDLSFHMGIGVVFPGTVVVIL